MEWWNTTILNTTGNIILLDLSFVENVPYVSMKLHDTIPIWKLPKESIMPQCVDKWQTRSCCRWLWYAREMKYPGIHPGLPKFCIYFMKKHIRQKCKSGNWTSSIHVSFYDEKQCTVDKDEAERNFIENILHYIMTQRNCTIHAYKIRSVKHKWAINPKRTSLVW